MQMLSSAAGPRKRNLLINIYSAQERCAQRITHTNLPVPANKQPDGDFARTHYFLFFHQHSFHQNAPWRSPLENQFFLILTLHDGFGVDRLLKSDIFSIDNPDVI